MSTRLQLALVALLIAVASRPAEARITKIVITALQSPTFAGTSFGTVGTYEKLAGVAYGEVDPTDARNAGIVDIALAPQNAGGMVEYSMDIFILKPVDMSHASGRLFYEVNNRGTKLAFNYLNTPNSLLINNDPTSAADAGDGFMMRRGTVMAWSGWDLTVAPGGGRMTITVPVATNPDSSPIVGPALEELIVDNAATTTFPLTYPTSSLDPSAASLTVRIHAEDVPTPIPSSGWEYVDSKTVRVLPPGTSFTQGRLYDLVYPATNPQVAGLAFAATRDVVAFLHHATEDDFGTPNPVAGGVQSVDGFGISQGARFLHDFLYLGFNEDEEGQIVFDGLLNYIAGPGGGFFNYRFAQPGRTIRQHRDRQYPEIQFPFTYQVLTDPVTGKTDGRLRRCLMNGTCPKIFDVNSGNEYWSKSASLLHVDAAGRDLRDPAERALLSDVEPPTSVRVRHGHLPTGAERALAQRGHPRAPGRARRLGGNEPPPAGEPRAAHEHAHARALAAPGGGALPLDPRRHLRRLTPDRRSLRLRRDVRPGDPGDAPAGVPRQPVRRFRAEDRRRRERRRGHPPAVRRGAGRDVHRVGGARRGVRR
jgi:hypothetical protein